MADRTTVWVVMEGDSFLVDDLGTIATFVSKEAAEVFMAIQELSTPFFSIREVELSPVKEIPTTQPFRFN